MKRIFALLITASMLFALFAGCTPAGQTETTSNDKLKIVTTIFPPYDFAKQVAGDHAEVTMLLKPGAESHSFEPTPQDIKTIQSADLFIYTGGENDTWVDEMLASMTDQQPDVMKLIDLVDTVEEEIVEGMEHQHAHEDDDHDHNDHDHDNHDHDDHDHDDHDHDDHDHNDHDHGDHDHDDHDHNDHDHDDHDHDDHDHDDHDHDDHDHDDHDHDDHDDHDHVHSVDEHVWTAPANAIVITEKIAAHLTEKDAAHADDYQKNSAAYIAELKKLDEDFREIVANSARKTMVFGDRFPFRYFADAYGLDYYAAFTGCSTETEASAATVAFLVEKVKEENIPVVFTMEFSNGKIADSIVDATGAKKAMLHSCHTISADELAQGETYLSIMQKNAETLKDALN